MTRFGLWLGAGASALVWWSLAAAEPPAGTDPLQVVRDALASGNATEAAAAAEGFIAASPGNAALPEAQLLLAQARERAGAWGAAWDQYSLFLANFPAHPANDEAAARVSALVDRVRQRALPSPVKWRMASPAEGARQTSDDEALVIAVVGAQPSGAIARTVTRAAVDGARVWVWRQLGTPTEAFDPFDDAAVVRLEHEFQLMAGWPVEGFVIDGELYLGDGVQPPAAARAYHDLSTAMGDTAAERDRLAWVWAGMRGRASAKALRRWVDAASAVNARAGWLVRVSPVAATQPERALRGSGEDLAELRLAAPTAIWAVDASSESAAVIAGRLTDWGSRPAIAAWPLEGDIVALP